MKTKSIQSTYDIPSPTVLDGAIATVEQALKTGQERHQQLISARDTLRVLNQNSRPINAAKPNGIDRPETSKKTPKPNIRSRHSAVAVISDIKAAKRPLTAKEIVQRTGGKIAASTVTPTLYTHKEFKKAGRGLFTVNGGKKKR